MPDNEMVWVPKGALTDIGDAIREKLGVASTYKLDEMPDAIDGIGGGITPTGTIQITTNGTHDVTEYADANVNVQPNLQSKTVNQNGTVTPDQGYDGLSSVLVNVSGGGGGSDQLMSHGQVSNTSTYMTANFDTPIDFSDYDMIAVILYEGQTIHAGGTGTPGVFFIERNSFGSGAYFTMSISTTSISCTNYRGSYMDLYVDVYGVNL